jgi:hypothetical protein
VGIKPPAGDSGSNEGFTDLMAGLDASLSVISNGMKDFYLFRPNKFFKLLLNPSFRLLKIFPALHLLSQEFEGYGLRKGL